MFGGVLEGGFGFVESCEGGVVLLAELFAELGSFLGGVFRDGAGLIGCFLETIAEIIGGAVEVFGAFLLVGVVKGGAEVSGGLS